MDRRPRANRRCVCNGGENYVALMDVNNNDSCFYENR